MKIDNVVIKNNKKEIVQLNNTVTGTVRDLKLFDLYLAILNTYVPTPNYILRVQDIRHLNALLDVCETTSYQSFDFSESQIKVLKDIIIHILPLCSQLVTRYIDIIFTSLEIDYDEFN